MEYIYVGGAMNSKLKIWLIIILIISLAFYGCKAKLKEEIRVDKGKQIDLENIETEIIEESHEKTDKVEVKDRIEEVSILAVGDLMYHIPQVKSAYIGDGEYDFAPPFKYVKKYIEDADISLANYETVTLKGKPYSGFPRFNSPKQTLLGLAKSGFNIISTANNHSIDQGKAGLLSTIESIEEYGLKNIGTYRSPGDNILVQEIKGIKIGFLSYTYGLNGLDSLLNKDERTYMVNIIDENNIKEDIKTAKLLGADLIVFFLHWGYEYHSEPSTYQIELGQQIMKWGGNIIFGSHPHVIQMAPKMENPSENYIIYSMGNFLSNQSEQSMGNRFVEDGVMVKLNIEKNFTTNKTSIKKVDYVPTWVYRHREGGKFKVEILPLEEIINGELEIELNPNILNRIEKSYKDTLDTIMGK